MKKRILSMLLVIVLVLSLVPVSALAEGEYTIAGKANVSASEGTETLVLKKNGVEVTENVSWNLDEGENHVTLNPIADSGRCTVVGAQEGKATVYALVDGAKVAQRIVSVYKPQTAVSIEGATTVEAGGNVALSFDMPGDITEKIVSWSLSKDSESKASLKKGASVNQRIVEVKPDAKGTITVNLFFNGASTSQVITVTAGTLTVTEANNQNSVYVNGQLTLTAKIGESVVTNATVTGAGDTVEVKKNGETFSVIGKQAGTATLEFTATDDAGKEYKGAYTVTVNALNSMVIKRVNDTEFKVGNTVPMGAYASSTDTTKLEGVTWSGNNDTVAVIDPNTGALTCKAAGEVIITAKKADYADATREVTVAANDLKIVAQNNKPVTQIIEGRSIDLKVVDGSGTQTTVAQWSSSNEGAATVDANGRLTGGKRSAGATAEITATVEGFPEPAKMTVKILCLDIVVPDVTVQVGQTVTLTPVINGDAATGVSVAEDTTAGNTGSVAIDSSDNCKITGSTEGTVKLKLTKSGGYTGTCTVTVVKKPLTVKADTANGFYVGKTYTLEAFDGDTKVTGVTWKVKDPEQAKYIELDSRTGKVTMLVAGVGKSVTVTAVPNTANAGTYSEASLSVTIQANALEIVDKDGNKVEKLNVNETVDLVARDGNGDFVTGVQWVCSDTNKAAFISDGLLKGIRQSSTPVTITVSKDSYTPGTLEISVSVKSFDIKNEENETVTAVEMLEGATLQLKAVEGENEMPVVWSSKDSRVTVDDTGLVTAKESTLREAVAIEARLPGYETKTVKVTVTKAPVFTAVKLDGDDDRSDKLAVGETRKLIALDADGLEVDGVEWKVWNNRAVLEDGELTGAEAGEVTVTATKEGYTSQNLLVNVYVQPVTGFDIASELPVADKNGYIPMEVGDELPLSIDNVQPSYASDSTAIEWVPSNSGDAGVAKVENGKLIAEKPGYVTLNARATNAAARSGDVIYQLKVHVLTEERIELNEEVPEEVLAGKSVNLKASVVNADGEPVAKTSVKWTILPEEEGVRLLSDKLETDSSMKYRHEIRLRAEAVGCEAEPLEVTVMVVPVTTGITLKVGEEKVNNGVFIVDLSDECIAENGIIVSATVLPASATQKVRWEISDAGNVCTEEQLDTDIALIPVSALKSGVVTVKAYAGDGTGVTATAKIQFSKLGAGKLKDVPDKLRGGASLDLSKYLVQDENVDDKTVTWSIEDNVLKNGKKIARIGRTGKLTTKPVTAPHTIKVRVTGSSGVSDTKTITLYPTAKSVKITCDELKAQNYTVELSKEKSERTFDFEATIKPDVLQDKDVWPLIWSSTNNDIATVDEDGQVVVKKSGKVRIDCMIADGSKVKGSVNLKVTSTANEVTVTPSGRTLASGNSLNMKAVIKTPTGRKAANQEVIWSIADEFGNATNAAIVSSTGRVTACNVDQNTVVVVTATSKENEDVFGSVLLTIKPNTTKTLHAIIVGDMISGSYAMNKGESVVVDAQWQRSGNGVMKDAEDCQFFSSNTGVATVDKDLGTLTAVGYGTSTITLRCVDPATQNICTSTFTVKVVKKVGTVTINAPSLRDLRSGKSVSLSATAWNDYANGTKADNQGFTWEVTENGKETDVATISSNGVLTAKGVTKKHTVVVKAISKESGIFDTATFNIFPAETVKFYFALNGEEYTGTLPVDLDTGLGGLKVRIHTAFANGNGNITEKDIDPAGVTWSTSDKNVIQITTAGPRALKVGKATLTAKYKIGTTTYESKITAVVNRTVGSVTIEQSGILVSGKSIYMRAKAANTNATNKNVLWYVDDVTGATESVADLVSINRYTGKLSAKRGITEQIQVRVIAEPVDGSISAIKTVTVYPRTTEVEIIAGGMSVISGTTVRAELSLKNLGFAAVANPSGAYNGTDAFKWTSSNTSVAEVDENTGVITLKKAGAATIKAIAKDGTGKYAKFTLRVTN